MEEGRFSTVRVELDIQAQHFIGQHMLHNAQIAKDIEAGVKKAFDSIDFEKEVENSVKRCIHDAIRQSTEWGTIKEAVKKKTDEIVDTYIENSINKFRKDFGEIHEKPE
jgi:hypothetical protein